MSWQYTSYVIPLAIAAALTAAVAIYAWWRRPTTGATSLALLAAAVTVWLVGYALQISGADWTTKVLWARTRYIGIVAVPVTWLTFALEYTGRTRWLNWRTWSLLCIEPVVTLALVWTNAWHNLIWIWQGTELDRRGPFPALHAPHGIAFWGHAVYAYSLMLAGLILLVQGLIRSQSLYRRQAGTVLVGVLVPLVGNLISTFVDPFPHLDMTPFAFTVGGLILAWALFHFRLLDIVPVARDTLIEGMGDGVIVLDARNRVVDLNPAAQRILGRSPVEAIGQLGGAIFAGQLNLEESPPDRGAMGGEVVLEVGEEVRSFDPRITPLYDRRGHLTGRLIVLRDITGRKRAEEALQAAKEAAEEANRAKSEFVSVVSHELGTPITSIRGYADVLIAGDVGAINELQAEFLSIIRTNADQMAVLISDLADISRIEAGRLALVLGAHDIADVVAEVVRSARRQVEEKGQQLVVQVPDDLPPVWGDHVRLVQVLSNLVNNAHKFTPSGGRITIRAECAENRWDPEGPPKVVLVDVSDSGIGVPPEDQERIFEKFVRSDDREARASAGTGLGLSIARSLVEMQGGRIWLESTLRQGSTFYFTVPVAERAGIQEG